MGMFLAILIIPRIGRENNISAKICKHPYENQPKWCPFCFWCGQEDMKCPAQGAGRQEALVAALFWRSREVFVMARGLESQHDDAKPSFDFGFATCFGQSRL